MAKKATAAKQRDDLKMFKLSHVTEARPFRLYDFYYSPTGEYGPSFLLKLLDGAGEKCGVWLGSTTAAFKAFKAAEESGQLDPVSLEGKHLKVAFRPKDTGQDSPMIELRIGGAVAETAPF